jgi:hypothetical protein
MNGQLVLPDALQESGSPLFDLPQYNVMLTSISLEFANANSGLVRSLQ